MIASAASATVSDIPESLEDASEQQPVEDMQESAMAMPHGSGSSEANHTAKQTSEPPVVRE